MSADQIILLVVGLIVIAAVAVTVAYATSRVGRGAAGQGMAGPAPGGPRDHHDPTRATLPATNQPIRGASTWVTPASTRQVARVVAFLFLAAVAVVVALTHAWPETEAAIFTLLAAGMLLVVLFMDMVPPAALGRWRRPAEGIGAIIFLGSLMALTGGAGSPFVVGFFLVVAGTALSTEGRAPLAVALVGGGTIALVGLVDAIEGGLEATAMAWVGMSAVSLVLLADIAAAAARAQRIARDEALRASRFDALTGLYNRAFFFTTMEHEIRRSDRMGRGFTMLMLDLDDLKPVNDTFGHQWGDRLLKAVADTIRRTIRFTDGAARYGGDEFVVLLPETDAAGGYVVAEKLRRDIAALNLHAADRNVRSSVSVGLVSYPDDGTTIEQLVAAADVAMYESKRRGKNRIVGYQARTERAATLIEAADDTQLVQLTPAADARTGGDPAPWRSGPDEARGQEPDPAPWAREDDSTPRGRGSEPAPRGREADPPPWAPEGDPASRARDAGAAPQPPSEHGDAPADQEGSSPPPWATRTNGTTPSTRRQAPTDPQHGGRGTGSEGRAGSSEEQPWIALPIEPNDTTDWPPRQRR